MSEIPSQDRLADLSAALGNPDQPVLPVPKLEDLKAWLDETRLHLWGQLQAAHADEPEFEERFRIRRLIESCQRLSADVRVGRLDPHRPELIDLRAAIAELGAVIAAGQALPPRGAGPVG
ncbi:MAG: hypothetical protein FJ206_03480 [Gemmatimonadetes bacterium]|nr:hypothetical protein [Gemmatimonadota bacterium]